MSEPITLFFGDGDHTFQITPALIVELERKTECGIGGLCRRLFAGEFHLADMIETIRLGLIGGGLSPADANALVNAYAAAAPLMDSYPVAVAILESIWFGATKPAPIEDDETQTESSTNEQV